MHTDFPDAIYGKEPRFRDRATLIVNDTARAERLPSINDAPWPDDVTSVPPSYCLIGVDSVIGNGSLAGQTATEHGGGTLIHPRVVLTDAHVVCHAVKGGFSAPFTEIRVSIAPPSRAHQPLVYACNQIFVANVYEADSSRYRADLAAIILPEPAPLEHVLKIGTVSDHKATEGETSYAVGMGLRSDGSFRLHDTLQTVSLRCVEARQHITQWEPVGDKVLEQGFSGGPAYDSDEAGAWFGPFSHYVDQNEGRIHAITAPLVALEWGITNWHRLNADRQTGQNLHSGYDLTPRAA